MCCTTVVLNGRPSLRFTELHKQSKLNPLAETCIPWAWNAVQKNCCAAHLGLSLLNFHPSTNAQASCKCIFCSANISTLDFTGCYVLGGFMPSERLQNGSQMHLPLCGHLSAVCRNILSVGSMHFHKVTSVC